MAEKEYIEREKTIKALKENTTEMESDIYYASNIGVPEDEIEDIVNEIPTADVQEVVRCKDCSYFCKATVNKKGFLICPASGMDITNNDFCSYGAKMNKE